MLRYGRYTFIWEHPANEVLVRGSFNGWQKLVRLQKIAGIFQSTKSLPHEYTEFQYIVDGHTVINETFRSEEDDSGNSYNTIRPGDFPVAVRDPDDEDVPREDGATSSPSSGRPRVRKMKLKLDRILNRFQDESIRDAFKLHGILDIWLPISQQTLQKIIPDKAVHRVFLAIQADHLDTEITLWHDPAPGLTCDVGHNPIIDDERVDEIRLLGEGAVGTVDEVEVSYFGPRVRCVRKRIGRPKPLKAHKSVMAAFAREIDVMRQVKHQHCVEFMGSYTDPNHVNILSGPVADMDLATFLDGPINLEERVIIYRGIGCICNAINYLHQEKIRHEDLKPQNILIHGQNILLTDFGFSLDFSEDSVSTTTGRPAAWTMRYAAPEVLNSEPRNRATDIFSLGCVLVEMISGYYGFSLSEVKAHWKETGNGQSSFARNNDATDTWMGTLRSRMQAVREPKLEALVNHAHSMIYQTKSMFRPTAQQLVDCLSDLDILLANSSRRTFLSCQGPVPCVGLSNIKSQADKFAAFAGRQPPPYLLEYLNPWGGPTDWAFSLWNMNMSLIGDEHHGSLNPILEYKEIIERTCKSILDRACKTGTTKEFWESHKSNIDKELGAEYSKHAILSCYFLSLRNIAFARVTLPANVDNPSRNCKLQITLLPICLSRSKRYGSFLWLISYPIAGPAVNERYNPEDSFMDLTIVND